VIVGPAWPEFFSNCKTTALEFRFADKTPEPTNRSWKTLSAPRANERFFRDPTPFSLNFHDFLLK
jgi:hypothetical protein